ncbi:MAG: SHOCT domain-containing protein [Acidobacteriota bacterium]|nr:SHOCT domain-containing protein [Acidobacteriota bacterium]MDE3094086.1 SHOCT domain-containing protein [Acidobacteriota bacterium]
MGYRHGIFFDGFAGNGPGLFGLLLMIAFWAAIALVILVVVRNWRHGPHHLHDHAYGHGPAMGADPRPTPTTADPAIDLLKERFARGEVSEEEFTRRLTLLKES